MTQSKSGTFQVNDVAIYPLFPKAAHVKYSPVRTINLFEKPESIAIFSLRPEGSIQHLLNLWFRARRAWRDLCVERAKRVSTNRDKESIRLKQLLDEFYYPNATSRNIMTVKPIIPPIVEKSELPCCCASGISSSITTYIIAPAANDKA